MTGVYWLTNLNYFFMELKQMANIEKVANEYLKIHEHACHMVQESDGNGVFSHDIWEKELGYGVTKVITDGEKIEKGAINFSKVSGKYSPKMAKTIGVKGERFAATGISSIFHPVNPLAPIIHMNVRYFELDTRVCWFGGGVDLTPHYVDEKEAGFFHRAIKQICDNYDKTFYQSFKKQADDYYFLKHRNETRGVGGIFFDHLKPNKEKSFEFFMKFTTELALAYPEIYVEILNNKAKKPFSNNEKRWQNIRRSRYVEFNLLYDRGTRFGIDSGGNAESIMVSMPPVVNWWYNYQPEPGSSENKTNSFLKKGINWLKY